MLRYLVVEDVMQMTSSAQRTVESWVSRRAIPHRKIGGVRRIFFVEEELVAWIDSGGQLELEVVETRAGRVVRPKSSSANGNEARS